MTARFTVLASGSAGNASLLEINGGGLLIDCGLSGRQIGKRLVARDYSWRNVHAAILSHTHGDHWRESALKAFVQHQVVLYCHPGHALELHAVSATFKELHSSGLVRTYEPDEWCEISPSLRARPLPVPHDGGPTCAFRFEGPDGLFGSRWALGYATDLGSWDEQLASNLADVDVLAIEFNHDVEMQQSSGRPQLVIDRIIGDRGHLSNEQATALLHAVRSRSNKVGLRYMVGLHASRQCNSFDLARAAAQRALADDSAIEIVFATQNEPTSVMDVRPEAARSPRGVRKVSPPRVAKAPAGSGIFDA